MNDFTKDELITLINAFDFIKDSPSWRYVEGWDDELKIKIQSMIDNYCEHVNDIRFNAYPIDGSPKMCTKCHGFYI